MPVMMTKSSESDAIAAALSEARRSPPPRHEPSLVRRQDPQLLPVLRDGAARDGEAAALQDLRDLLVGQRLRGILVREEVLDHLLHRDGRHHLAVAGLDA